MGAPRIGCSGWDYRHWRGDFYPADTPRTVWLQAYSAAFDTVELNNSFYRLPEASRFAAWAQAVPAGFVFAVKASRYLTHLKRLAEPDEPIARLIDRASHLGPALGPILYQLPPRWVPDRDRFETFLRALPKTVVTPDGRERRLQHAIEFRDPRGYDSGLLSLMRHHGIALCLHDMPQAMAPRTITAGFVYVRFHGHDGTYGGGYARSTLEDWAHWLAMARQKGTDVFAYFNNDVGGHAPRDAQTLRRLLDGPG